MARHNLKKNKEKKETHVIQISLSILLHFSPLIAPSPRHFKDSEISLSSLVMIMIATFIIFLLQYTLHNTKVTTSIYAISSHLVQT